MVYNYYWVEKELFLQRKKKMWILTWSILFMIQCLRLKMFNVVWHISQQ